MKSEKILCIIPKLQKLSRKQLDTVDNAVNACLIVQGLDKSPQVDCKNE